MHSHRVNKRIHYLIPFTNRHYKNQLKQDQADLMKVSKELDSFVYSVSHNIRSPIASILGLLNLAKQENTPISPALINILSLMEERMKRIDATIKEIVQYSQNSRLDVMIAPTEIISLVNSTVENLKYMSNFDAVNTTVNINQYHTLFTDSHRIKAILNNILSNAIKFRDPNQKSIAIINIYVTREEFHLSIEDNGIGIPREFLPRVFDIFFRATTIGDGDGLGLYVVREIALKLRGNITIESTLGVGTKLSIEFPNKTPDTWTY